MSVNFFYMTLAVGLLVSLAINHFFGVNPGAVVPGYLALICDDVSQMLLVFAVTMTVYFIVNKILPKFVILFGQKKFTATLLVGILVKLVLELLFPSIMPFAVAQFRGIGVMTPAIIANNSAKQKFRYTIPAVLAATYITFGIATAITLIF